MSRIRAYLLGSPYIERDGHEAQVDTRKAIALLAYLVVTGHRQSRDTLAALLWPENDDSGARAALRRTLSTLNKAVDGVGVSADREALEFARSPEFWLDVDAFDDLVERAASLSGSQALDCLTEAVALYRGDFLDGFHLRDGVEFDNWQYIQAEHYRRKIAQVFEGLVDLHEGRREVASAIDYAQRWKGLDPMHEPAHRRLMMLYAQNNQRAMALRQYRECVQVLDRELGVAPLEETTRLYELIKENRVQPVPEVEAEPAASPVALPDSTLPLAGRSGELALLESRLQESAHRLQVVVLQGEPGIGKTRLAEVFFSQSQARLASGQVLSARCYAGESQVAYGLVISLLRAMLAGQDEPVDWLDGVSERAIAETARLYPAILAARPGLRAAPGGERMAAQARLFEAVSELIGAYFSALGGGVLFLEDLHWADNASGELLAYLLRRIKSYPVMGLLTWRVEEVEADNHLLRLFAEERREGWVTIVNLGRLDESDIEALLGHVPLPAGGSKDTLVSRLFKESEGLPLFVVGYLAGLAAEDFDPAAELGIPLRVGDLLRSRLAHLSDVERQVLGTGAVIGRSFDYDTLRAVSGRSEEETVAAVESLLSKGLILEVGQCPDEALLSYDFYHAKLRSLLYDDLSLVRRRLLHRRIADYLAQRVGWGDPAGGAYAQIAYHYDAAREDEQAAAYHTLAAEEARALHAHHEAIGHFKAALAQGSDDTAQLHLKIGESETLLGQYKDAVASFETAAALAGPEQAAAIDHKLGGVYHRLGEWDLAASYYQTALALCEKHPEGEDIRARIKTDWCLTAYRGGEIELAADLAEQALELAESSQDTLALAQAHNALGILARSEADHHRAVEHFQTSLSLAESLDAPGAQVAALNNLALAYRESGDLEQALRLTEAALTLAGQFGDRHREAALHSNYADLLHATDRAESALEHLKQSAALLTQIGGEEGIRRPEIWKLVEW
jgi:DNA-binding SARP family transcriptional activator/predicted ATPase